MQTKIATFVALKSGGYGTPTLKSGGYAYPSYPPKITPMFTQRNYSRLSSSEVQFYMKTVVLRFRAPLGRGYGQHTMFILGSLESVNLTSFTECWGWSATSDRSEYRLKIGVFAPTGSVCLQNFGYKGSPHQPFSSENYGWIIFHVV